MALTIPISSRLNYAAGDRDAYQCNEGRGFASPSSVIASYRRRQGWLPHECSSSIQSEVNPHKSAPPTWILHPEHGWQKSRSPLDRVPVVTLVERGGRARSRKVENVTAATLRSVVLGSTDTKSRLMTDELHAYRRIGQRFAGHDAVNHGEEEWARKLVEGTKAHTNTVEGFFSLLKCGIYGCYFHVSEQHLHPYLAEFDFRYSNRIKLGVDDTERTRRAIKGAGGKRLTYRRTRSQGEEAGAA